MNFRRSLPEIRCLSLVALLIAVYPVVDVVSRVAFAGKICAVVVVSNMAGVLIYRVGRARNTLE